MRSTVRQTSTGPLKGRPLRLPTKDTMESTTSFALLNLAEPIQRALAEKCYITPSPIQAQAIPHLLNGRDLLGCAQTGTGKTAAFALPILHRLATQPRNPAPRRPRALVLTPTRELAVQISDSFTSYGKHLSLRHTVIFGGVGQNPQVQSLKRGAHILVATPGRLLDLEGQGAVDLRDIEILVLDEADRMLDMGFIHDVKRILKKLPQERQSLLFSATMPGQIQALASSLLRDPVRVEVDPVCSTVDRIDQSVCHVAKEEKARLLMGVLNHHAEGLVLVFARTKHGSNRLATHLTKLGVPAEAINGNKSQSARQRALESFRTGATRVLVATDVAARGIDVKGISLVVNFDLPNEPESYVHRIGRTARAGADGIAVSFCDRTERSYLRDIERLIRKRIPESELYDLAEAPTNPIFAPAEPQAPAQAQHQPSANGRHRHGHAPRRSPHRHEPPRARHHGHHGQRHAPAQPTSQGQAESESRTGVAQRGPKPQHRKASALGRGWRAMRRLMSR